MKSIFTIILYIEIIKSHDKPLSLHLWIVEWLPLTWEVFVVCETMFECVSVFSRSNLLSSRLYSPLRRASSLFSFQFLVSISYLFCNCCLRESLQQSSSKAHWMHINCCSLGAAIRHGLNTAINGIPFAYIHKNEKQKNPFNSFMEKK